MDLLLKLLLISAFFNALSWIVLIPVWQYPDEQAHFAQVQNIAELGFVQLDGFNTSREIIISEEILDTIRDTQGNNKFTYNPWYRIEYSKEFYGIDEFRLLGLDKSARKELIGSEATFNPPLYYFLSAGVYRLFYNANFFERVFAIRLFSSFFYILTVIFTFKIGALLFKDRIASVLIAVLVAFMPMFVFSTTGVLPDSLTNLLFTIIIFLSIKFLIYGVKARIMFYTLIIFIMGVLTRQHFLIAVPIIASTVFYRFYKSGNTRKFCIFALIITPLFLLSQKFLTSYPIINNFRIPDISNINPKLLFLREFLDHTIWTVKHTYAEVLPWYWGVYKWLSLTQPHIYYEIINRLLLLSLFGLVIYFLKVIRAKQISRENLIIIFFIIFNAIYFISFLFWDYFFRLRNNFSFGIQGRYFFPFIVTQMTIVFLGLSQLSKFILGKYFRYSIVVIMFLMIISNDFSLFYISSSYYDISSLSTFILEASQYKPVFFKGNFILSILSISIISQLVFFIVIIRRIFGNDEGKFRRSTFVKG